MARSTSVVLRSDDLASEQEYSWSRRLSLNPDNRSGVGMPRKVADTHRDGVPALLSML